MQSSKNRVIIASAGGSKTTFVVRDALSDHESRTLITTYTRENVDQIKERLVEENGCIPPNITIESWFSFLLLEGVRPYQQDLLPDTRVLSVDFETKPVIRKGVTKKDNPKKYYLSQDKYILQNRVTDFICRCNEITKGAVISRLEKFIDRIYIDELQDLAGWDHNFVELLLESSITITMVGDPRQSTYTTNTSTKNKAKKGKNIITWVNELVNKGLCNLEERVNCYRSNQEICDFADSLFPDLPRTTSKNSTITGHDGIFEINKEDVDNYIETYNPQVLRWNKKSNTLGHQAINIGVSKGRTYPRVLIFPTNPMKAYLKTKDLSKAGDLTKFYVAVTRARFSVAFVID